MLEERADVHAHDLLAMHRAERSVRADAMNGQDDLRALERDLDRLTPRLLPRLRRLEDLRRQGSAALVQIARLEQAGVVSAKARSRIIALQPATINRLRVVTASLRHLRRNLADRAARHQAANVRQPMLFAQEVHMSSRRDSRLRQRDATIRSLAATRSELARLLIEERRLARIMLARRASVTHHWVGGAMAVAEAALGNQALRQHRSAAFQAGLRRLEPVLPSLTSSGRTSVLTAGWTRWSQPRGGDRIMASVASADELRLMNEASAAPLVSLTASIGYGQPLDGDPLTPDLRRVVLEDSLTPPTALAILTAPRQAVAAPEHGTVVFADRFRSYGLLLIIQHNSEYHTLLWGFSRLDVELGDDVHAGQILGIMGAAFLPTLHVELRRNGRPVSPELWLAASNNGVKG